MSRAGGQDRHLAARLLAFARVDRSRLGTLAALVAIAAALGAFFLPLFTRGVSALTGDNVTHSLPFHLDLSRALGDAPWRLWDSRISFGFPGYAEGTSGAFHPWKLVLFALLPGLAAHDLLYVASFLLTGASGFGIARAFGIGVVPALTGALAVAFSPVVLGNLYNASYAHSTAWAALCLLAFEHWWSAPSRRRAGLLGLAVALVLTSGYVPTAYALFLFLGVVLVVRLASDRRAIVSRALGCAAAFALGMGLAALQILPLAELAGRSVRQESVAALNAFPWPNFLGGLVFDPDPVLYQDGRYGFFAAPLSTVLAAIALPFLFVLRDARALSYVGGIAVCVGAAAGEGSALFELLRVVLPGFDRLRILSPFLFVTVAPAGVLLAVALDHAARGTLSRTGRVVVAMAALAFLLLLAASTPAATALPWYRNLALGLLAAAALGLVALRAAGLARAAPLLWLAVIAVEIAVLRTGHRAWLPDTLLDAGRELAQQLGERSREDPEARAIHFPSPLYRRNFEGMVLQHWKSPGYASFVRGSMRARTPFANLLDDLPFVEANGALPLAGYPELLDQMHRELRGRADAPLGERAVDRWRVRWVVLQGDLDQLPRAEGLESVWRDPQGGLELLENRAAQPRLRFRPGDTGDAPEAPAAWRRAIEALPWVRAQVEPAAAIDAPRAGRVSIAVPAYPGWTALVDGRAVVPRRGEDGFGMEIPVEAGAHRIELRFVPHAFHLGVVVSAASALLLAACLRGRGAA